MVVPVPADVSGRLPPLAPIELRGVVVQGQLVQLVCKLEKGSVRYECELSAE